MCGGAVGDIFDKTTETVSSGTDAVGDWIQEGIDAGKYVVDQAGNVLDDAGAILAGPGKAAYDASQRIASGSRVGLKPLMFPSYVPEPITEIADPVVNPIVQPVENVVNDVVDFGREQVVKPAIDFTGDVLEEGKKQLVDPIIEDLVQPIIAAPFNLATDALSGLTEGILGPSASVLGQAGGFYPASDQLGDLATLGGETQKGDIAPVKAAYDPYGAGFLRDPRDRRYINSRSTLLTGSRGVQGAPNTRRRNAFGFDIRDLIGG